MIASTSPDDCKSLQLNRVQFENHGPALLGSENVSAVLCP